MPSLVARFAENIFWAGRYMERAENLARILDINETYARDEAEGPSWDRVLNLYADHQHFVEEHGEPTAPSVLHYYLLDRENPSSVWSCIKAARENARSVRHLISTEMWTQINQFQADIASLQRRDISVNNLSRVSRRIITQCQGFEGVAEGTFLRGEAWCFYHLGKYLERADQTTRILDMGYDRLGPADSDAVAWVQWSVLLRSVSGYHAYRSRHPGISSPYEIAIFLLYDPEFPRSVALCVDRVTSRLRDLQRRHGTEKDTDLEKHRRKLQFLVETGPGRRLTPARLHKYLDELQSTIGRFSLAVGDRYFKVD